MFRILCIFAMWIGWFGHHPISGKSVAASTISMTDRTKSTDIMAKRKTLDEVKSSFCEKWGDRFIYDHITDKNYVDMATKIPIECREHGLFWQSPHDHLLYCGCKACANISRSSCGVPRISTRKKLYGVGINDSTNPISYKGTKNKSYELWKAMLARCYSKKNIGTAYEKCFVCDSWLYFSNFESWFGENYKEGYHLDKDLIIKGNTIYSPDSCSFVPPEINTLLVKHNATRGQLPIGVAKTSDRKRYRAIVRISGKYVTLGRFDSQEEAFAAYKSAKEAHIQEMATQYYKDGKITEKVYSALMNYKVEITD